MSKDQIFMGSGYHSLAKCHILTKRLFEGFDILNGIQQPPRPTDSEEIHSEFENDVIEGSEELDRIVREIAIGLTGKKIKFID